MAKSCTYTIPGIAEPLSEDELKAHLLDGGLEKFVKEKAVDVAGIDENSFEKINPTTTESGGKPPTEIPPIKTKEGTNPEEWWSGIRKERIQQDIKGAKKLFEDTKNPVKWSQSMEDGLREVAERYPDKSLYDAAKTMVNEFAQKFDKGVDFNPTTKELAVMQYLKAETGSKIEGLKGVENSSNEIERLAGSVAFDALNDDLISIAKALNPQEAGRAFAFRQSEIRNDPDYGLQIRRMELMKANGEPLSDEDMKWTQEQWNKERELLTKEHELRMQGQQQEFEKKIEQIRKEYEEKLKQASGNKKQTIREKTLSQKGKDIADQIRRLKTDKGSTKIDFSLGTWDLAVEGIAKLVEAGSTIAEAIDSLIKDGTIGFKTDKEREKFEGAFVRGLTDAARRENAINEIKKLADESKSSTITNDMVSKNHIKDFVDSHIGKFENKDILKESVKELKGILPDVTEDKLREAYLKKGDFKQPTKRQLETSIRKGQEEIRKLAKKELTANQRQKIELQNQKQRAESEINQYKKKIENEEYAEPEQTTLNKADAELIKLEKQRADIESLYRKKQNEYRKKNNSWAEKIADFTRSAYVALLIGGPKTMLKVASMSLARPLSEAGTKLTFGKIANIFLPNISEAAKRGGESSSWRSVQRGFEAYFRQMGEKGVNRLIEKSEDKYNKAVEEYNNYKNSDNQNPKKLEQLKSNINDALLSATGNLVYKFIGGSSIKDAVKSFVHRTNEIEKQMGGIIEERFKEGNWLDKATYILNFVGRSHSALKTFSGRFSFAAGFMARLEQAVKDGEELSGDRVLEMAHESYLDWERGKYQQNNAITNAWNKMLSAIDRNNKNNPEFNKYEKAFKKILQGDIAITRVPLNILHEAVMEYTLGAFRSVISAIKQVNRSRKEAIKDYGFDPDSKEFKDKVKELVSNMDEKQAATIIRSFRKGWIGLGLYALFSILGAKYGVFPHKGQRKKKDEDIMGTDELNPGQVQFGDTKLGETASTLMGHIPVFFPAFMGLGMSYIYNDDIDKGKSKFKSATDATMTHLEVIQDQIPQFKFGGPVELGRNIGKTVEKRAEDWGLISSDN